MAKTLAPPELVNAGRSHHLELPRNFIGSAALPFEKEEVWPTVRVTIPRAGTVVAEFSADRYVYGDRDNRRMGEWRIVLRDVRSDAEDGTRGALASGVGPAARTAIRQQAEPVVLAWLASSGYASSRRKAAARTYRRLLKDTAGRGLYAIEDARRVLASLAGELAPLELSAMKQATEGIAAALELLDREPIG